MKIEFKYRDNGSPSIVCGTRESEVVSYQGIAALTIGPLHYIGFGDYYSGHAGIKAGVVYRLTELRP